MHPGGKSNKSVFFTTFKRFMRETRCIIPSCLFAIVLFSALILFIIVAAYTDLIRTS